MFAQIDSNESELTDNLVLLKDRKELLPSVVFKTVFK